MLDSVTSDEPDDHIGDGSFPDDIQGVTAGTPDLHFQLRVERMQHGGGRTYTATDGSGPRLRIRPR